MDCNDFIAYDDNLSCSKQIGQARRVNRLVHEGRSSTFAVIDGILAVHIPSDLSGPFLSQTPFQGPSRGPVATLAPGLKVKTEMEGPIDFLRSQCFCHPVLVLLLSKKVRSWSSP